tara:strand:+ start:735 stop:965 length:231 start_codon:yes stop_codon:yes gene_type:complete
MGIIDTNRFRIGCPNCGSEEVLSVHEKGSGYDAPYWQDPPDSEKFHVRWADEGVHGPIVTAASCRACSAVADVQRK